MGRYLALGVATTIQLSKKKNYWVKNYNLLENKQEIMDELNDLVDVSKYDCKELENKIILTMKPECFNDNIHDLIKELYPMIDCKTCMEHDGEIKFEFDDNFNKENYPINLSTYEDGPDKGWMYCEYFQKEDYTFYEA